MCRKPVPCRVCRSLPFPEVCDGGWRGTGRRLVLASLYTLLLAARARFHSDRGEPVADRGLTGRRWTQSACRSQLLYGANVTKPEMTLKPQQKVQR